jgi:hypothetical protein
MRNKPETRINDTGKESQDQLPASIRRIFENPQKHPDDVDIAAEMAWILENDKPKRPRGDSEADQKAWDEENLRRVRILTGHTRGLHKGDAGRDTASVDLDLLTETMYGFEAYVQERGVVLPPAVKGAIMARLYGFECRREDIRWLLEISEPKRPCGDSEAEQKAWFDEFLRRLQQLLAGDTHTLQMLQKG